MKSQNIDLKNIPNDDNLYLALTDCTVFIEERLKHFLENDPEFAILQTFLDQFKNIMDTTIYIRDKEPVKIDSTFKQSLSNAVSANFLVNFILMIFLSINFDLQSLQHEIQYGIV